MPAGWRSTRCQSIAGCRRRVGAPLASNRFASSRYLTRRVLVRVRTFGAPLPLLLQPQDSTSISSSSARSALARSAPMFGPTRSSGWSASSLPNTQCHPRRCGGVRLLAQTQAAADSIPNFVPSHTPASCGAFRHRRAGGLPRHVIRRGGAGTFVADADPLGKEGLTVRVREGLR